MEKKTNDNVIINLKDIDISTIADRFNDPQNNSINNINILAGTIYSFKMFSKAEELGKAITANPEIEKETIYNVLPELVRYNLFNSEIGKAELKLRRLQKYSKNNIEVFHSLLEILAAYGFTDFISNIYKGIDIKERFSLEHNISETASLFMPLRGEFISYCQGKRISELTAIKIFDSLIIYIATQGKKSFPDCFILQESRFREFISSRLNFQTMSMFETAAIILWGCLYLFEMLLSREIISQKIFDHNLNIILKIKAFLLVNIPWNGYWRLKFIHLWERPLSVSEKEFEAENKLFCSTLCLSAEQTRHLSILKHFASAASRITYSRHLEEEENAFIHRSQIEYDNTFGCDVKKDSVFPYLNVLSGEYYDEFKAAPDNI